MQWIAAVWAAKSSVEENPVERPGCGRGPPGNHGFHANRIAGERLVSSIAHGMPPERSPFLKKDGEERTD